MHCGPAEPPYFRLVSFPSPSQVERDIERERERERERDTVREREKDRKRLFCLYSMSIKLFPIELRDRKRKNQRGEQKE